jgi:SnoaL-like polyketide cyclase
MSRFEQLKAEFADMYLRAYEGDFQAVRDLCSPSWICRNPLAPMQSIDAVIMSIQEQRAAFEASKFEIEYAFAGEGGFGVVYTLSGRHVKEIFGLPPSGKYVKVAGISIHELIDWKSIGTFPSASFVETLTAAYDQAKAEGTLPEQA